MKKPFSKILAMLPLAVVCSCSQETVGDSAQAFGDEHVSFAVTDGSARTRAALSGTSSLDAGFGVSSSAYTTGTYATQPCGSYFHDITALPDVPTIYYWPVSGYNISFYAYYPKGSSALAVSSKETVGAPVYTYTVPTDNAAQLDVMTAQRTDMPCSDPKKVELSFTHHCSDIRFTAYNQGTVPLTVNSISIYGVKYTGTLKEGTWTLSDTQNSPALNPFTLTLSKTVAADATEDLTGTSGHFIMIPQTIAAGTQVFVVTTTENGKAKTYTHTLEAPETWAAGKSYGYKLILGDGILTVDPETDIQDWAPNADSLTTSADTDGDFSQKPVGGAVDDGINDWTEQQ